MPALPLSPNPLSDLISRAAVASNATLPRGANPLEPLQVVCSWTISGQYGPGSRILYYVLVAACLLARKTEWLRNASLAAALIFPAVAAIHGIVLAALHDKNAVDFDIYGAFQFCSIGILTAPVTVRLSSTYFNNPGRNVIFVWIVLVLTGLVALTVEFFKSKTQPCLGPSGEPLYSLSQFSWGNTTCGLPVACTADPLANGPASPMRQNSANNIYVVPAPYVLTFGASTLIAAACCIPAILSMVTTWDKIVRTNWRRRFGDPDADELIEGTNGATVGKMKTVNDRVREFLSVVEIPLFGGVVIALIIVGEINFFSPPVYYQTEPMANVGEWAPIVASVMAACGSLYMLLAENVQAVEDGEKQDSPVHLCHCPCHERSGSPPDSLNDNAEMAEVPQSPQRAATLEAGLCRRVTSPTHELAPSRASTYPDAVLSHNDLTPGLGIARAETNPAGGGKRREVARFLFKAAQALGTALPGPSDDYDFRHSEATNFPVIPGEENRNSKLGQIQEQWAQLHERDDALTPRGRHSRANSFHALSRSNSIAGRAQSPQRPAAGPSFLGLPTTASPETTAEPAFPLRPVVDVERARSQGTVVTLHSAENSPAIILSPSNHIDAPDLAGSSSRPVDQRPP